MELTPLIKDKSRLSKFLKDIPSRLLAQSAFNIKAYSRALQYFEIYLRQQGASPVPKYHVGSQSNAHHRSNRGSLSSSARRLNGNSISFDSFEILSSSSKALLFLAVPEKK